MNGFIAVILSLMFVNSVYAHDEHNWLDDHKAFEYTKNAKPREVKSTILNTYSLEALDIDMDFFSKKLEQFTGQKPVVIDGQKRNINERGSTSGRSLSIQFLQNEFLKLGYTTTKQKYTSGGWFKRKGINLISKKIGQDTSKTLVLVSHYDSVKNAGANDNGSGTIGMLTIAKALKNIDLKYNVEFIQFDQEELGLIGSKAYVKQLTQEQRNKIIGVINADMIGTNTRKDNKFHAMDCDRQESMPLTNTLLSVVQTYSIDLTHVPSCTTRSDHAAFWVENIPAIIVSENFFGGDSDPCYHRSCDVFDERIQLTYVKKMLTALTLTVIHTINN